MQLHCPKCETKIHINEALLPESDFEMECKSCHHLFLRSSSELNRIQQDDLEKPRAAEKRAPDTGDIRSRKGEGRGTPSLKRKKRSFVPPLLFLGLLLAAGMFIFDRYRSPVTAPIESIPIVEENVVRNEVMDQEPVPSEPSFEISRGSRREVRKRKKSVQDVNRMAQLPEKFQKALVSFQPSRLNELRSELVDFQKENPSMNFATKVVLAQVYAFLGLRQNNPAWLSFASKTVSELEGKYPQTPELIQTKAIVYYFKGQKKEAFTLIRSVAPGVFTSSLSNAVLGRLSFELQNHRKGKAIVQKALEKNPDSFVLNEAMAEMHFAGGDIRQSEVHYRKLGVLDPKDLPTQRRLATVLAQQGKWLEAIPLLEALTKNYSNSQLGDIVSLAKAYRASGKTDQAIKVYESLSDERISAASSDQRFRYYSDHAQSLYAKENYAGAIELLKKGDALKPNDLFLQRFLGDAHFKLKEYDLSVKHYKNALAIDPEHSSVRKNHAIALFYQGQGDAALKEFQQLLKRGEKSALLHYYLARIYKDKKEQKQALVHVQAAEKIDPKNQDVFQLKKELKSVKAVNSQ